MKQFAFPVGFNSLDAATALFRERDFIWLDSNKHGHSQNRYSYIVYDPSGEEIPLATQNGLPPFQGGYIGYRTYEGQNHFKFYTQVLAFDHQTGDRWFIVHAANEQAAHEAYDDLCTKVRNAKPLPVYHCESPSWVSNFTPDTYKQAVALIIERILNGDIFQANLTQQFEAVRPTNFDGFFHYLRLRDVNPAPFAAYIHFEDIEILSTSPECFLELDKHGHIKTHPIKGTDADKDKLIQSEKDKAENAMIVDLMRNDFSRICEDESVHVDKFCELQSFAGLHHLVSIVSGRLRASVTAFVALEICSPGGSITGAPKIEAVKILNDIEQTSRGVYCGSLGFIGADGAMNMNIAIRTLVATPHKLSFGVGGGITAMSDPRAEYEETLLKAHKIFRSFEGVVL